MITVNELFSGIGAQVAALRRIGVHYNVVGISEIDKFAIKSYEAINGKTRNYGDICKVESLDYADLWTYSFPCQDLSIAGKHKGLNGTRSGLLREVERLLKTAISEGNSPKYLLLENVKNLVGKKFKQDFDNWLSTLNALGYNNYWKVLNAKDYGVPQNRERVFVVSIRKDVDTNGYTFPEPFKLTRLLKDVLETNVDECYNLREDVAEKVVEPLKNREISNTIRCGGMGSTDIKHTWDLVYDVVRVRKLTPKECWRLMDFTDEEFELAKSSGVSNSKLYKQAGNSIVVGVLAKIFERLFKNETRILRFGKENRRLAHGHVQRCRQDGTVA